MKSQKLICLLLACWSIQLYAQNNYVPMESITDWYISASSIVSSTYYWYSYQGDTLINDKEYRKIDRAGNSSSYPLFIREEIDSMKVYKYLPNLDIEYVFYDFSLEVGDTFNLYPHQGNDPLYLLTVSEIDTVPSSLGPLRRWKLSRSGLVVMSYTEAIGARFLNYGNPYTNGPTVYSLSAYRRCEEIWCSPSWSEGCMPPDYYSSGLTQIDTMICEGDIFMGHDTAALYQDTLSNMYGCDSVVLYNLMIDSLPRQILNDTICEGEESYGFTTSGTHEIRLPSTSNCDTLLYLDLTVLDMGNTACITALNNPETTNVTVYPNPMKEVLHIASDKPGLEVDIYDIHGKVLLKGQKTREKTTTISTSYLKTGMYLVHVKGKDRFEVFKVLKQ